MGSAYSSLSAGMAASSWSPKSGLVGFASCVLLWQGATIYLRHRHVRVVILPLLVNVQLTPEVMQSLVQQAIDLYPGPIDTARAVLPLLNSLAQAGFIVMPPAHRGSVLVGVGVQRAEDMPILHAIVAEAKQRGLLRCTVLPLQPPSAEFDLDVVDHVYDGLPAALRRLLAQTNARALPDAALQTGIKTLSHFYTAAPPDDSVVQFRCYVLSPSNALPFLFLLPMSTSVVFVRRARDLKTTGPTLSKGATDVWPIKVRINIVPRKAVELAQVLTITFQKQVQHSRLLNILTREQYYTTIAYFRASPQMSCVLHCLMLRRSMSRWISLTSRKVVMMSLLHVTAPIKPKSLFS